MINEINYFENNRYLSNSKIGDWLKDKEYFYKKHISNEIAKTVTDAMIIGKAVDCWLTEGKEKFDKKYVAVTKRSRKFEIPWDNQLNQTQFDAVSSMCSKAERTDAVKALKDFTTQEIISYKMDLGENFDGLCGIPDWYKGDGDECIIVDLKTAADATPNKYYWHCLSFGYFRQQAMYQFILNKTKGYTKFTSKHLVIEKDIDCIHNSYAFILDQNQIESEKKKLELIFEDIKNEKDFAPRNATWDEALIIGGNEII